MLDTVAPAVGGGGIRAAGVRARTGTTLAATTDATVLDYLRRRWRRRLDATTIPQAQQALALPPSTAQRIRLYRALAARPAFWRRLRSYGQTAVALTLTEGEKLTARAILSGATFDEAAAAAGLHDREISAARQVYRAIGLLQRGHLAADTSPFTQGVGLNFHTVRVEGEPTFAVH